MRTNYTHIRVPLPLHRALHKMSTAHGCSMADLIISALKVSDFAREYNRAISKPRDLAGQQLLFK